MNCNTCAAEVFGDSVFCGSCGAIIDGSSPPPANAPEAAGAAFEPTQMIPVHDEAAPAPVQQPAVPLPLQQASSQEGVQQPARRPAAPVYVPEQRRSTIPLVAGALLLLGLVVLGFVLRGVLADDESGEDVAESSSVDDTAADDGDALDPGGENADGSTDEEQADETVAVIDVPDGFRLYEGACFAAAVPDSWTISEDSGLRSYGRRTAWARGDDELFVDTSPLRDATVTGREAADEQLNNRTTATSGLIEESGRDDMWSYTYTRSGAPAIAIYFVEERGFGVVGSSRDESDAVVQEARRVAESIQVTNPDC